MNRPTINREPLYTRDRRRDLLKWRIRIEIAREQMRAVRRSMLRKRIEDTGQFALAVLFILVARVRVKMHNADRPNAIRRLDHFRLKKRFLWPVTPQQPM